MSPCGTVMDFRRRGARSRAEFGTERGLAAGWIRWYPALPGAKTFPAPHAFVSPRWEDQQEWEDWDEAGEGPGVYMAGQGTRSNRYQAPPGTHFHGELSWFIEGIPAEVLSGEVPPPPPDPECLPMTLTVLDVSGGATNATFDDVTTERFDRATGLAAGLFGDHDTRLSLLPASASQMGAVTTGEQVFAGGKTFLSGIAFPGAPGANSGINFASPDTTNPTRFLGSVRFPAPFGSGPFATTEALLLGCDHLTLNAEDRNLSLVLDLSRNRVLFWGRAGSGPGYPELWLGPGDFDLGGAVQGATTTGPSSGPFRFQSGLCISTGWPDLALTGTFGGP